MGQEYAFVIRPFNNKFRNYYRDKFPEAWKFAKGPKLVDADDYDHKTIYSKVKDYIDGASIILCDITKESPNVYWEHAYADACGKPIILMNNEKYQRLIGEKIRADVQGIQYITYEWSYGKDKAGFCEDLKRAVERERKKTKRRQRLALISSKTLKTYLGEMKEEKDLFVFINVNNRTKNLLNKLSGVPSEKIVFHFEASDLSSISYFQKIFDKGSGVYVTPLYFFADLVIMCENCLIFSLRDDKICLVQHRDLEKSTIRWREQFLHFSILVDNYQSFRNLAETLREISYRSLELLKEEGVSFFEKSEYWFETPTVILKHYLDNSRKDVLWSDLQRKINQNFSRFAREARKKAKYIYAIWPLTKGSESLDLAGGAKRIASKEDQSYWIKQWLRDLNVWAKRSDQNSAFRYLLVSGEWRNGRYRLARGKYRSLLKKVMEHNFMKCSYKRNIYVIFDHDEVFAEVFGTNKKKRELIISNTILFSTEELTSENIRGYLQIEEPVPIKNHRNILNFRYLNLMEGHKQIGRYLDIFRTLKRSGDENTAMTEGGPPCLIPLEDFYGNYLKNR